MHDAFGRAPQNSLRELEEIAKLRSGSCPHLLEICVWKGQLTVSGAAWTLAVMSPHPLELRGAPGGFELVSGTLIER